MKVRQRVLRVRGDGASILLQGDSDFGKFDNVPEGSALPFLLDHGWRIAAVYMTGSGGDKADQNMCMVVLEKND